MTFGRMKVTAHIKATAAQAPTLVIRHRGCSGSDAKEKFQAEI